MNIINNSVEIKIDYHTEPITVIWVKKKKLAIEKIINSFKYFCKMFSSQITNIGSVNIGYNKSSVIECSDTIRHFV